LNVTNAIFYGKFSAGVNVAARQVEPYAKIAYGIGFDVLCIAGYILIWEKYCSN